MKKTLLALSLLFTLTACTSSNETTTQVDPAGTQLAGTPVQTQTPDGQPLVGGDAVASPETPGKVSFTVLGSNFAFDLDDITVQEGDEVTINFRSAEGYHDWVLDEFGAATEAVRGGEESSVTFVADKKGTYEFYCSIGNHRAQGMVGTLTVE